MTSLKTALEDNSFPGRNFIRDLVIRYDGFGDELNHDETEILLFALYCESLVTNGIVSIAHKAEEKMGKTKRQAKVKKGVKLKKK